MSARLKDAARRVLKTLPPFVRRAIEAGAAEVGFPNLAPKTAEAACRTLGSDRFHDHLRDLCDAVNAEDDVGKRFRPLLDRVVIRRDEPDHITAGGIVIPDVVRGKKNAQRGIVVAVGPGLARPADAKLASELNRLRADFWPVVPWGFLAEGKEGRLWDLLVQAEKALENPRPIPLKPGDAVYMAEWTGTEIEVDGEKLLLVREDDIIAVEEAS